MFLLDFTNQNVNTNPGYPANNIPYMDTNQQYNNYQPQSQPQPAPQILNQMGAFAPAMVEGMALQYGSQVILWEFALFMVIISFK